jgi:hypothetical protein
MRSRITVPKLILPVALIVIGVTCLCPIIRKSFPESDREETGSLARGTIPNVPSNKEYDPFADPPMDPPASDPNNPRIKAKFVESGSGTEELAFDWIVTPFSWEDENDSSEN